MSKFQTPSRLAYFSERRDAVVSTIRELVEIESPSDNKAAVGRIAEVIAEKFVQLGGEIRFHRAKNFGNHLQVNFAGKAAKPVLLLSDEEVGSDSSRAITESLAKKAVAVLVLEPSYGLHGAVKTARKGVGGYLVKVTGKASHAGLDFEKGVNAILELARQIERISSFTDLKKGLTVNVGIVSGGSRTNVVPAEASAHVDVRIARMKDAAGIDKKMRGLRPFNRKCKLEITGGINRPPMERTAGVAALYAKAVAIAGELGWRSEERRVGKEGRS